MIALRCARLRAALVDFADGRLEEPTRGRVERHVARCADCAETVLALREAPAKLARRARANHDERFWAEQRRRIADAIDRAGAVGELAALPIGVATGAPRAASRRGFSWQATFPALATAATLLLVVARDRTPSSPAAAPTVAAAPVAAARAPATETAPSDESLVAFLDEPSPLASPEGESLEDSIIAGIDESLGDTLAGYSDGSLI